MSLEKYGGQFLVRGARVEQQLEGKWEPMRLIALPFDSVEQAKAFVHVEEEQAARRTPS